MRDADSRMLHAFKDIVEQYPMDKITVTMICRKAGVHRQSFYYHYKDIIDMITTLMYNEIHERIKNIDDYHSWTKAFRVVLDYLKDNEKMIDHIYESSYHEFFRVWLKDLTDELLGKAVMQKSRDMHIELNEEDRKFMIMFYGFIFDGLIKRFIEEGMKDDTKVIVKRCEVMLHGSFTRSMNIFVGK